MQESSRRMGLLGVDIYDGEWKNMSKLVSEFTS